MKTPKEPKVIKPRTTMPPIPVRATIAAAIRLLKAEWWPLLRIVAVPIVVMWLPALLTQMPPEVTQQIASSPKTPAEAQAYFAALSSQAPHFIISFIVTMLMMTWVHVAGLRYLILGEKSDVWFPNYQPRMWRYLWKSLLVMLTIAIAVIIMLPLCLVLIGFIVCPLVFTVVATRISLAVPATAIQDDNSMKSAWERTRGQVMRITTIEFLWGLMLFTFMIIPTVIAFLVSGMSLMEAAQYPMMIAKLPHPARELTTAALGILNYIVYVIGTIASFPVTALLYAHFYQDKQSPAVGDGGSVGI